MAMMQIDTASKESDFVFARQYGVVGLRKTLDVSSAQRFFDTAPPDASVKDGTRFKSIARVCVSSGGRVRLQEHGPLFQSADYNHGVYGQDCRRYAPMDRRLLAAVCPVIRVFAALANVGPCREMLVQAQRVRAPARGVASTVHEDWHSDGTEVLGIFVVSRTNVGGGVSLVASDAGGRELLLSHELRVGELLLIQDSALYHNATPIVRRNVGLPGYRDIVIITCPACRPPGWTRPRLA